MLEAVEAKKRDEASWHELQNHIRRLEDSLAPKPQLQVIARLCKVLLESEEKDSCSRLRAWFPFKACQRKHVGLVSLSPACWTCWSKSSDENTVIPSYTTSYYFKCLPIEFVASTDDARQRKLICNFSTVALLYNLKRPEGNRIPWFGWILLWPCSMFIKFLSPPKIRLGTRRDVATCSRPFHLLSHSQILQASMAISRSPVYECQIPGGFHTWKDDQTKMDNVIQLANLQDQQRE